MKFKIKIDQDMVVAAKEKDKITLSALRLIKTALHYFCRFCPAW
jgi:uncharacterized protein YqeY